MRTIIHADPFSNVDPQLFGQWPAHWISCPHVGAPPFVTVYRCRFSLNSPRSVRIHVTADERYHLMVDSQTIGRGPERGDADNWFFETYDLDFSAGVHHFTALVWSLGDQEGAGAPYAQMSLRPGFLLSPQDQDLMPILATGIANWETKKLSNYEFISPTTAWGTGFNTRLRGSDCSWYLDDDDTQGWLKALKGRPGITRQRNDQPPSHRLTPATLPPQRNPLIPSGKVRHVSFLQNDADAEGRLTSHKPICASENEPYMVALWQEMLADGDFKGLTIEPNTRLRVLIDLENYYCAYPSLSVSRGGGSRVRIHWQEALFNQFTWKDISKGNRDEIEGKYFTTCWRCDDGVGDEFWPHGGKGRTDFVPLWWQCGRYVEVVVETGAEPLEIHALVFEETRYPLEMQSHFTSSDNRLAEIAPIMLRGLQMCAHETYMDCPFYEQLQYVGDTRLQALATYVISPDDRLARKAILFFDQSRLSDGLTQSRYPSRIRQTTRPFALWWVAMVHDYALWRDDWSFVQKRMPGVRSVIEGYKQFLNADSLIELPPGPNLNFMDWVREWGASSPPDGGSGINSLFSLQWALVLTQVAELETWCGETELSARTRRLGQETFDAVTANFWDETRGLFADDLAHSSFSEHSQCLAVLTGLLDDKKQRRIATRLAGEHDLHQTTIYFSHYLFEAFRVFHKPEALLRRMDLWFALKAQGLKTPIEMPEPTRSDCHAWGAHPLFHYFATMLGIRPSAPGFSRVEIAPQLGTLQFINGTMPHPRGELTVDVQQCGDSLRGSITLPEGVTGVFRDAGREIALTSGMTEI